MIMKLKVMKQYRVISMVELEQMLQCPSIFVVLRLDIMHLYRS